MCTRIEETEQSFIRNQDSQTEGALNVATAIESYV
jgi:hypothetical protein